VLGNLCCGCNILMHNKFSCGHTVLENNLRENSSLSYLLTKPTKQVFKFVRTKTETCALKLETIRGPSALSVYTSNLWFVGAAFCSTENTRLLPEPGRRTTVPVCSHFRIMAWIVPFDNPKFVEICPYDIPL
jgi:hypothetical protein